MIVANPPFGFADVARHALDVLCRHLGDEETAATVEWVVPE